MNELRPNETNIGEQVSDGQYTGEPPDGTGNLLDESSLREGKDVPDVDTGWVQGSPERGEQADLPLPEAETPAVASPPIIPPIIGGPPSVEGGEGPEEPEPVDPGIEQFDSELPTVQEQAAVTVRFTALCSRVNRQHAHYTDTIDLDDIMPPDEIQEVFTRVIGQELSEPLAPDVVSGVKLLEAPAPQGPGRVLIEQAESPTSHDILVRGENSDTQYSYYMTDGGSVLRIKAGPDQEGDPLDVLASGSLGPFEEASFTHVVGPAEMAHLEGLLERAEPRTVRFRELDEAVGQGSTEPVSLERSQTAALAFRSDVQNFLAGLGLDVDQTTVEYTSVHALEKGTVSVTVGIGPEYVLEGTEPPTEPSESIPFVRVHADQALDSEGWVQLGLSKVANALPLARLASTLVFRGDSEGWFWSESRAAITLQDGSPLLDFPADIALADDNLRSIVRNFIRKPLF